MNQFMSGIVPLVDEARLQYANLKDPEPLLEPVAPEMPQDPPVVPPDVGGLDMFLKGFSGQPDPLLKELTERMAAPSDYATQQQTYSQRLSDVLFEEEQPTLEDFPSYGFDLASALGEALLTGPANQNPFIGLGQGFVNYNKSLKAGRDVLNKTRQQVALKAAELAMQDEREAKKLLDSFTQDVLKDRHFSAPEMKTYQYNNFGLGEDGKTLDFTGEKAYLTLDAKQHAAFLRSITGIPGLGLREISEESLNLGVAEAEKEAVNRLSKTLAENDQLAAKLSDTQSNLDAAKLIAEGLGEKGFGELEQLTLGLRNLAASIPWLDVDTETLGKQQALGSVTLAFALQNVSQTKGAVSNAEMNLFLKGAPYLGQTYKGFMTVLRIQNRIAEKKRDFVDGLSREYERLSREETSNVAIENGLRKWQREYRSSGKDKFLTPKMRDLLVGAEAKFKEEQPDEYEGVKNQLSESNASWSQYKAEQNLNSKNALTRLMDLIPIEGLSDEDVEDEKSPILDATGDFR